MSTLKPLQRPPDASILTPLETVFSLPELSNMILVHLSRQDIHSLRASSWTLWDACTNTAPPGRWFHKDVRSKRRESWQEEDIVKDTRPIATQNDPTLARFVRSFYLTLPTGTGSHMIAWVRRDWAISQYLNLRELAYKNIDVIPEDWERYYAGADEDDEDVHQPADPQGIARQILMLGPQLRKIYLQLRSFDEDEVYEPTSERLAVMDSDCAQFSGWLQLVDHLLEPVFLSKGYLAINTMIQPSFSSLQALSLAGHKRGSVRIVGWETLVLCLARMPVLRELTLTRIQLQLIESLGAVVPAADGIHKAGEPVKSVIFTPKQSGETRPEFKSLRKLALTESVSKDVGQEIVAAFTRLEELSVLYVSPFWTRSKTLPTPMSCSRRQGKSEPLWTPFPWLKRLAVGATKGGELLLNDVPMKDDDRLSLPQTLVHLEVCQPGLLDLPTMEPGTALRNVSFDLGIQDISWHLLSHECCNQLSSLNINKGLLNLQNLLKSDDPAITDSWACDHFTDTFLKSRLKFAPYLKVLYIGGDQKEELSAVEAKYLNRLLGFMPNLVDLTIVARLVKFQDLFEGLGRCPANEQLKNVADAAASKDARLSGRPLLHRLKLGVKDSTIIQEADDDFRQRFHLLEEVSWATTTKTTVSKLGPPRI